MNHQDSAALARFGKKCVSFLKPEKKFCEGRFRKLFRQFCVDLVALQWSKIGGDIGLKEQSTKEVNDNYDSVEMDMDSNPASPS